MEKYEALEIEIIFFDNEDVITASGKGDPTTPKVPARYYDDYEEDE